MTTRKFPASMPCQTGSGRSGSSGSSSHQNQIPDHILKRLGVKSGDEIEWAVNDDGIVTVYKAKEPNRQLLLVESICSFKMRYLVEVEARNMESAARAVDAIRNSDIDEFSQEFTSNNIINMQQVSLDEAKLLVASSNYPNAVDYDVDIDPYIYRTPTE